MSLDKVKTRFQLKIMPHNHQLLLKQVAVNSFHRCKWKGRNSFWNSLNGAK